MPEQENKSTPLTPAQEIVSNLTALMDVRELGTNQTESDAMVYRIEDCMKLAGILRTFGLSGETILPVQQEAESQLNALENLNKEFSELLGLPTRPLSDDIINNMITINLAAGKNKDEIFKSLEGNLHLIRLQVNRIAAYDNDTAIALLQPELDNPKNRNNSFFQECQTILSMLLLQKGRNILESDKKIIDDPLNNEGPLNYLENVVTRLITIKNKSEVQYSQAVISALGIAAELSDRLSTQDLSNKDVLRTRVINVLKNLEDITFGNISQRQGGIEPLYDEWNTILTEFMNQYQNDNEPNKQERYAAILSSVWKPVFANIMPLYIIATGSQLYSTIKNKPYYYNNYLVDFNNIALKNYIPVLFESFKTKDESSWDRLEKFVAAARKLQ